MRNLFDRSLQINRQAPELVTEAKKLNATALSSILGILKELNGKSWQRPPARPLFPYIAFLVSFILRMQKLIKIKKFLQI